MLHPLLLLVSPALQDNTVKAAQTVEFAWLALQAHIRICKIPIPTQDVSHAMQEVTRVLAHHRALCAQLAASRHQQRPLPAIFAAQEGTLLQEEPPAAAPARSETTAQPVA